MSVVMEIKGIKKRFPGIVALNWDENDSIRFEGGVIYALLGENGAGKSTLSKIIAGIYRQDEGEILLDGVPFQPKNSKESREYGIGIVLQETGLIDVMKVSENLLVCEEHEFSTAGIYSIKKQHELASEMLKKVCPEIDAGTLVSQLSLEDQKMVELARAVSTWPKVLLIDETSASLSKENVNKLFDIIRQAKQEGVIVLMVTHRMEEVFDICDQAVILKDGRLIKMLPVAETNLDEVSKLMVGRAVNAAKMRERPDFLHDEDNPVMLKGVGLSSNGYFKNVSFDLHKGEIIGVAGLNGGGKDELLPALFGEIPLHEGFLELEGSPYKITSFRNSIDCGIAYLAKFRDRDGIMLRQPIAMNVLLPMYEDLSVNGFLNTNKEKQVCQTFIEELMVKCGSIQDTCDTLSGGNRQKVILARWIANGSRILLMDNPTRGIDVGARAEIYRLLNDLTAKGYSVLMVSDDLPEILSMCDQIIVIRRGEVSHHFMNAEQVTEHDILVNMI